MSSSAPASLRQEALRKNLLLSISYGVRKAIALSIFDMCGIAGIVGVKDVSSAVGRVSDMIHQLQRRGPDDSGIESWQDAVLGHRRLSIFDLSSAGHQPMLTPDGDIGIVFNGAIYNFHELRAELETLGYEFRSRTDTEVLLHGYKQWGIDTLVSKIDGMFAFGVWDNAASKLFLVRDRLGVKPLAYCQKGSEIAFASTVRALGKAGYPLTLSTEGLLEYLEFGFITDERSIYYGIKKVAAATIVEWHNGSITERVYWAPPKVAPYDLSFEGAVERTEEIFLSAVKKRLLADVSVGALLSGGIDSSLVCWAISELGSNVTAYTVGTPDERFDESSVAGQTAKRLGIKHEILALSGSFLPDPTLLARAYPEPFACSSALGMLSVSELVRKEATVLLTGDGGDDVFLGYPEHKHFYLAQKAAKFIPPGSEGLWRYLRRYMPRSGPAKRLRSFADLASGGLGAVTQIRDGLPFYIENDLLPPQIRSLKLDHREIEWSSDSAKNLLEEFLAYDRRTRFVGEYLPKVDGATMYHALESRSPFLDLDLWEYAASIPYSVRLNRGKKKAILRKIAEKHLGTSLAGQKKQGFLIPAQKWLANEWRDDFFDILSNSRLDTLGFLDSKRTLESFERFSRNGEAVPRQYWFIYVLELWLREEKLGE